jgi:hypothetical protein
MLKISIIFIFSIAYLSAYSQVDLDRFIAQRGDGSGAGVFTASALKAYFNADAWKKLGNSGNSDSYFLGTIDAQPLVFRTKNVENLRIDTIGNLLLKSYAFARISGFGYSTSSYPIILLGDGTRPIFFNYDPKNNINGAFTGNGKEIGFANGTKLMSGNTADNGFHTYATFLNGTTNFNGFTGINTSTPSVNFEVTGNIRQNGLNSGTLTDSILCVNPSNNTFYWISQLEIPRKNVINNFTKDAFFSNVRVGKGGGTNAIYNTVIGANGTGGVAPTGTDITAIGSNSAISLTSASRVTAIGSGALQQTTTGVGVVAIGVNSSFSATSASGTTAIGDVALSANKADNNTGIGANSGSQITTGPNNLTIGANAQVNSPTANNQVSIANNLIRDSLGRWGVETTNPSSTFNIKGTLGVDTMKTTNSAANDIVTATASGRFERRTVANFLGSIPIPTLQQVSAAGNTTTLGLNADYLSGRYVGNATATNIIYFNSTYLGQSGLNVHIAPKGHVLRGTDNILRLDDTDRGVSTNIYTAADFYSVNFGGSRPMTNSEYVFGSSRGEIVTKLANKRVDFQKGVNARDNYVYTSSAANQFFSSQQISDTARIITIIDNGTNQGTGVATLILPQNPQNNVEFEVNIIGAFGSVIMTVTASGQNILISTGNVSTTTFSGNRAGKLVCRFLSDTQGSIGGLWIIKLI